MVERKKILIVEDETSLAKTLVKKITLAGFKAVLAFNGREGLKKFKLTQPDLILLDIDMPVMDGLTMLKKLRKTSNVPVIILTNLSDKEKLSQSLQFKSYDYLIKTDFSLEEVINKINEVLKR